MLAIRRRRRILSTTMLMVCSSSDICELDVTRWTQEARDLQDSSTTVFIECKYVIIYTSYIYNIIYIILYIYPVIYAVTLSMDGDNNSSCWTAANEKTPREVI